MKNNRKIFESLSLLLIPRRDLLSFGRLLVRSTVAWLFVLAVVSPAQAAIQAWVTHSEIPTSRYRHASAATTMSNGDKRVFVFGGVIGLSTVSSVEAYDPVTGLWDPASTWADIPVPLSYVSGALSPAGKIYLVGGGSGPTGMSSTIYIFDPNGMTSTQRGQWTHGDVPPLLVPRLRMGVTFGPDGMLYAVGGTSSNGGTNYTIAERVVVDGTASEWETLADFPEPYFPKLGLVATSQGTLFAVGTKPPAGSCQPIAYEYMIDSFGGSWTARTPMPTSACLGGSGLVAGQDGFVYAVNDGDYFEYSSDNTVYRYNPIQDSWSSPGIDTEVGGINVAVAVLDGRLYVTGGITQFPPPTGTPYPNYRIESLDVAGMSIGPSPIIGMNLRGTDQTFISDVDNFVANYSVSANTTGQTIYALDYDASATTLYGIDFNSSEYGTINIDTGVFTTLGSTNLPLSSARGLTAHPDGTTWYVIADSGADNEVWVGDITTGVFASIGISAVGEALIDIACDSQGNLFAHSITTDNLYAISSVTGAETLIGPLGVDITWAQGMDFDWSSNTLYAALYEGGGVGQFVSLSTTTGAVLTSEATDSLNAEIEMAVKVAADGNPGVGVPFCDPNSLNCNGVSTTLSASFGSGIGSDLHLSATNGPGGEFGYFLMSAGMAEPGITLSRGQFCLVDGTNPFGRYITGGVSSSIGLFSADGLTFDNLVMTGTSAGDTGFDVPASAPLNGAPALAGGTWNFQLWHRDSCMAAGESNFSNGLSVTFP